MYPSYRSAMRPDEHVGRCVLSGVLQPAEDKQGHPVDAAEARLVVGLRSRQIPSAGSGDTFESDTRELYISSRGGGGFGSLAGSGLAPRLLQDRRRRSYLHAPSRSNGRGGMRTVAAVPRGRIAPCLNATVSIPLPPSHPPPRGETLLELPRREFAGTLLDVCPVQNCARGGRAEGSGSASIRGARSRILPSPQPMRLPRLRRLSRRAVPRDGDFSELGTEVGARKRPEIFLY